MQDTEQAQERVLRLPARDQAAYLALCLEHAVRIATKIGAMTNDEAELFESVSALAWGTAANELPEPSQQALVVSSVMSAEDRFEDEMRMEFLSLASAARLVAELLPSPQTKTKNVLNLVDDFVSQADPEGDEEGAAEEGAWREDLLAAFEGAAPRRANFDSHLAIFPAWAERWLEDWNR